MRRSLRARFRRLTLLVASACALGIIFAIPAGASVDNPGTFTATVEDGSLIDAPNRDFPLGVGDPQCDDGLDNDGDTEIDWDGPGPANPDAECDAEADPPFRTAAEDDDECVADFQPPAGAAPTIEHDVNGAGAMSDFIFAFDSAEVCVPAPILDQVCFTTAITVTNQATLTGQVTALTATTAQVTVDNADIRVTVADACGHDDPPNFDECEVDFDDVDLTTGATGGVSYDESTATATLVASIASGPSFDEGAEECGEFFGVNYAEELNDSIGLPGAVATTLVLSVDPTMLVS